jgi:hypothetical protein
VRGFKQYPALADVDGFTQALRDQFAMIVKAEVRYQISCFNPWVFSAINSIWGEDFEDLAAF